MITFFIDKIKLLDYNYQRFDNNLSVFLIGCYEII